MPPRSLITHLEPVQVVQARASRVVAQRAALAFAEQAVRVGLPVDVVTTRGLKARIRERVLSEAVPV
jgi:predicted nucleotidyltransferase